MVKKINVIEITNEDFKLEEMNINKFDDYPDSIFFIDESIESLIDELNYNGLEEETILERNQALYGNFIEFYYHSEEEIYMMEYGIR